MAETKSLENLEILATLRRLEGVIFAGQLSPAARMMADCSCQNCGCDARAGGSCSCNEKCSCQGHTADRLDWMLNPALGVAAVLPIEDVKTLVQLRDKLGEAMRKRAEK
jgi:hypothetical protein